MHQIVFPARACGMEAGSESQHRTKVNLQAGFLAWASVPPNTTPDIRPRSGSSEGGGGEKLLNLTPRDLFRSARAVGHEKATTKGRCLERSRIAP
jgi:hypothetical protein